MATTEGLSVLQMEYSGVKEFSRTFQLPPASQLFDNLAVAPTPHHFQDLKFTTHFLAKVHHSWEFKLLPNRTLQIQLRVQYNPDKGYKLHPSKALLFAGDKLKAEAELDFKAVKVGSVSSDHVWSCTTIEKVDDYYDEDDFCYMQSEYYEGPSTNEYIAKWDDSVDSIRVVLKFQCESTAKYLNSQPLKVKCNLTDGLGARKNLNTNDFFLNDFLSDVTLVCESERFPAHRFVLSCQSAVFQRMFQVEMKEKKEGVVEIQDVESIVLKEVLHFMYKDELSTTKIGVNWWRDLYKVAHKYEIEVLKVKCRNYIVRNIFPKNAIQVLVFADLYKDEGLKLKALELIKRDKKKVMNEPGTLMDFNIRYPHLAFDLFNM